MRGTCLTIIFNRYTHEGYTELVKLPVNLSLKVRRSNSILMAGFNIYLNFYLIFLYHVLLVEEIQYTVS